MLCNESCLTSMNQTQIGTSLNDPLSDPTTSQNLPASLVNLSPQVLLQSFREKPDIDSAIMCDKLWGYPRPTNSGKWRFYRGPFIKMNRLYIISLLVGGGYPQDKLLLMVQKSGDHHLGCTKPGNQTGFQLPTSTGGTEPPDFRTIHSTN